MQVMGVVVQAMFEQINIKPLLVVEVSSVGEVAIEMDTHLVVPVGLILVTIVAVSVTLEMQVAGVVVYAAVMVATTRRRSVVAVLMMARVAVGVKGCQGYVFWGKLGYGYTPMPCI